MMLTAVVVIIQNPLFGCNQYVQWYDIKNIMFKQQMTNHRTTHLTKNQLSEHDLNMQTSQE